MALWTRRFSLAALVVVAVLLVALPLDQLGVHASSCCATCLSQTDPNTRVITYDPLVFSECSGAKGICCYGCAFSHGSPSYASGVTFNSDGIAQATAGTTITFAIKGVSRVTYDFLAINQAKKSFVGNESNEADGDSSGSFSMCMRSAGTIFFRGWGGDACTQVTDEYSIAVAAGNGATCDDPGTVKPGGDGSSSTPTTTKPNQPVTPQSGSKTGENDVENCSPTRGTIRQRRDGSKFCECLGDWRNAPYCDAYSWTKTILTVLGALAAVFSIAFSVRAYLKSKKAEKSAKEANDLDVMSEHEMETLRISPAKQNQSQQNQRESMASNTSTMASMGMASPATATTVGMSSYNKRSPVRTPMTTTSRHETTL